LSFYDNYQLLPPVGSLIILSLSTLW